MTIADSRGHSEQIDALTAPCGHNDDLLAVLTNTPCGKCAKKAHRAAMNSLTWCEACREDHPGRPHSRD
jgi:hypothetical protein